jgi:dolichol-phosphate mannosyltransferase
MTQPAPFHPGQAKVAVVVPAYCVEQQIERVVRGIPGWVAHVIVVVDASPDGTWPRVEALQATDPGRVVALRHEVNRGVGGAMQTGLREALRLGADVIVKMDGDDQMDPGELPRLVTPLLEGRADVSKGNRYASTSSVRNMPFLRIAGNAGLTFLVKAASGYWNLFDPANGFIAMRAEVLGALDLGRLPRRYFFESGLLIELGIRRAVVQDVSIPARYGDESSSLSIVRTLLGFPPRLVWGLLRRVFWRYFVHDFSAVSVFLLMGLPLLAWGLGYGSTVYWEMHRKTVLTGTASFATAGQVMIAAMPIILGFQLLLQAIVLDVSGVPHQPLSPALRHGPARSDAPA